MTSTCQITNLPVLICDLDREIKKHSKQAINDLLKLGGFSGNGGAFFVFELMFLFLSSDEVSKSGWRLLITSLSLLKEFEALLFFLGGLDGGGTGGRLCLLLVLPLRLPRSEDFDDKIALLIAVLLPILMQPIPLRFFGFLERWF